MQVRLILSIALVMAGMLSCLNTVESGDKWHAFWKRSHGDLYQQRVWPRPFVRMDRESTQRPFEMMKNSGWRLHNTIYDPLFEENTQELTEAGRLLVHWIVTQAPLNRRTVFVYRGTDSEQTQKRVASVTAAIREVDIADSKPVVVITDVLPADGSGEYYDAVKRKFQESIPAPVLPNNSGNGEFGQE